MEESFLESLGLASEASLEAMIPTVIKCVRGVPRPSSLSLHITSEGFVCRPVEMGPRILEDR